MRDTLARRYARSTIKDNMIILKTPRLQLRPFQECDLVTFAAYRSDPEVARYQSWSPPFSVDQARAFLAEMQKARPGTRGTWYQLAVERLSEAGLIGDCAFQILPDDERQGQVGFTFSRAFQKQGFATEAVRRLLEFIFTEYHLHRVTAICDALNIASARLLERVGMRREGHYLENIFFKGAWGDEFAYSILDREWAQQRDLETSRS
jgi:RimJ/RimL family protein N-acetyltransferase